jgi:hypothetical protein
VNGSIDQRGARVAALYDIHGNLPALDAVLGDVARAGADLRHRRGGADARS